MYHLLFVKIGFKTHLYRQTFISKTHWWGEEEVKEYRLHVTWSSMIKQKRKKKEKRTFPIKGFPHIFPSVKNSSSNPNTLSLITQWMIRTSPGLCLKSYRATQDPLQDQHKNSHSKTNQQPNNEKRILTICRVRASF